MSCHRQPVAAVIGPARATDAERDTAEELGEALVSSGLRLVTGGLGGIMEAASRGAHASPAYRPGATLGILPTYQRSSANAWVDIAIPSGLGHARNVLVVSTADVVLALGGRSGTLSEIALAWTLERPIIAVAGSHGWTEKLAGLAVDDRRQDRIHGPLAPRDAAALAAQLAMQVVTSGPREF